MRKHRRVVCLKFTPALDSQAETLDATPTRFGASGMETITTGHF